MIGSVNLGNYENYLIHCVFFFFQWQVFELRSSEEMTEDWLKSKLKFFKWVRHRQCVDQVLVVEVMNPHFFFSSCDRSLRSNFPLLLFWFYHNYPKVDQVTTMITFSRVYHTGRTVFCLHTFWQSCKQNANPFTSTMISRLCKFTRAELPRKEKPGENKQLLKITRTLFHFTIISPNSPSHLYVIGKMIPNPQQCERKEDYNNKDAQIRATL